MASVLAAARQPHNAAAGADVAAGRDVDRLGVLGDGCGALALVGRRRVRAGAVRAAALTVALGAVACALLAGAIVGTGGARAPAALLGVRQGGARVRAARISYAGIVPYVEHRAAGRPRAVACGAGSSVGCVLSAAEQGVRREMAGRGRPGPGRLAVEQAAKGKGFAPWDVSDQTKAAREKARRAVAASSGHGQGLLPPARPARPARPVRRVRRPPQSPARRRARATGLNPPRLLVCRARLSQLALAPGRQSRPRNRLRRAAAARACPARNREACVSREAWARGQGNGVGHFDHGTPPACRARMHLRMSSGGGGYDSCSVLRV